MHRVVMNKCMNYRRWSSNTFMGDINFGSGIKYIFSYLKNFSVLPKSMRNNTQGCQEKLLRTWEWAKETTELYLIIWMTDYCSVYFKLFRGQESCGKLRTIQMIPNCSKENEFCPVQNINPY